MNKSLFVEFCSIFFIVIALFFSTLLISELFAWIKPIWQPNNSQMQGQLLFFPQICLIVLIVGSLLIAISAIKIERD